MIDITSDKAVEEECAISRKIRQKNQTDNKQETASSACNYISKSKEEFSNAQLEWNRIRARLKQVQDEIYKVSHQHDSAISSHFSSIDELLNLHDASLANLEQSYFLPYIQSARERHASDIKTLTERHEKSKHHIQTQINDIQAEYTKQFDMISLMRSQDCEEICNQITEDMNALYVQMEAKKEDMHDQLRQLQSNADFEQQQEANDDNVPTTLEALKEINMERTAQILQLQTEIEHLERQYQNLQTRIEQELTQEYPLQYASDVGKYHQRYKIIKRAMEEQRQARRHELVQLSQVANQWKEKLVNVQGLAERVLQRYQALEDHGNHHLPLQTRFDRVQKDVHLLQVEEKQLLKNWHVIQAQNRRALEQEKNLIVCNTKRKAIVINGRSV